MPNNSRARITPRPFALPACTLALLTGLAMCVTGCGDQQTILEATENVRAPDGVLPQAGPKFCSAQRPAAQFACRTNVSCLEYLPEYEIPVADLEVECEDDGGELVKHCAAGDLRVLGACVENDRLSIAYSEADQAKTWCEEETYEWVPCPSSEAP